MLIVKEVKIRELSVTFDNQKELTEFKKKLAGIFKCKLNDIHFTKMNAKKVNGKL